MRLLNIAGRAVLETPKGHVDVAAASEGRFSADPQQLFPVWEQLREWAASPGPGAPAHPPPCTSTALNSPVPRPPQVFAVGLNYAQHAEEAGLDAAAERPLTFTKFPSCISAPHGELPLTGTQVDWEVELVAVIGRSAHHVSVDQAWDYIAGLTVGQDFSDRAVQMQGSPPQFSLGKSFPGFGPLGPALVTPDELPDANDLFLRCSVNDETVQEGRTSQMIHSVASIVALLSGICALSPGDVVFTGTPDGVGMGRDPVRYLSPGDVVVTSIDGIGAMQHRCVLSKEARQ